MSYFLEISFSLAFLYFINLAQIVALIFVVLLSPKGCCCVESLPQTYSAFD